MFPKALRVPIGISVVTLEKIDHSILKGNERMGMRGYNSNTASGSWPRIPAPTSSKEQLVMTNEAVQGR